jgi:hypothetical protein
MTAKLSSSRSPVGLHEPLQAEGRQVHSAGSHVASTGFSSTESMKA